LEGWNKDEKAGISRGWSTYEGDEAELTPTLGQFDRFKVPLAVGGVRVGGTDTMRAFIEFVLVVEPANSARGATTHKVGKNAGEGGSEVSVALCLRGAMGSEADVLPGGVVGGASVVD
jgi:hypothetical protein